MLRRVVGRPTLMTLRRWLFAYPTQVLTETTMSDEHLRHPIGDTSGAAVQPLVDKQPNSCYDPLDSHPWLVQTLQSVAQLVGP